MNTIKELFFPLHNFVLRFHKEGDFWVLKMRTQEIEMYQSLFDEDSKNA